MPKYLIQGSYTEQGLKGLLKEGGSKRKKATRQTIEQFGGKLEAFYYAFGSDDFIIILDVPSDADMTAIALDAQASGTVKSRVTVLITPEEVDDAVKKHVKFRAPGQ
ncbi:MAG TPA: GYD domain-containing protein [Anaerolineae bacterium]|nr:GYD domain-containing protein [Anaerolineae bacterium]